MMPSTNPPAGQLAGDGIIFVLSPPRAGSTLLQRILLTHPQIHSAVSEPWLALRLFPPPTCIRRASDIGARWMDVAHSDLLAATPKAATAYDAAAASMMQSLYAELRPPDREGLRHFYLDKTPRYLVISEHLLRAFPGARFIALTRNPLAVAASIHATWSRSGLWNLWRYDIDMLVGMQALARQLSRHDPRVLHIRYEDLVVSSQRELDRIAAHLGLPSNFDLDRLQQVRGTLGDPTGVGKYGASISRESLDTWTTALAPPWRRAWAKSYLRRLGPERLSDLGYDATELESRLNQAPFSPRCLLRDPFAMALGATVRQVKSLAYAFLSRFE